MLRRAKAGGCARTLVRYFALRQEIVDAQAGGRMLCKDTLVLAEPNAQAGSCARTLVRYFAFNANFASVGPLTVYM